MRSVPVIVGRLFTCQAGPSAGFVAAHLAALAATIVLAAGCTYRTAPALPGLATVVSPHRA